jgi:hypothetical protein
VESEGYGAVGLWCCGAEIKILVVAMTCENLEFFVMLDVED